MTEIAEEQQIEKHRAALQEALESESPVQVTDLLEELNPAEIADLLEGLPQPQRVSVSDLIDPSVKGEVLLELGEEARDHLIADRSPEELAAAIESLEDVDDQADLLLSLPRAVMAQVLHILDLHKRERLEAVLSYPEDTAGGLMNTDQVTVRADVTLDVVLRYLRMRGELPEHTDQLFVVDRHERFLGGLPLSRVLTAEVDSRVGDLMNPEVQAIPADLPDREVARLFEDRDLISAPVVEDGMLIGRITIDDVVDVIREEAEHSVMSMAGLSEDEDIFAPVVPSARRRAIWLGVNLMTAFLASWSIGLFESTLDKIVALAVLMPIVASMGGIAGSQTLTLVIRGLALGQVGATNARWLASKELLVGLFNGVIWSFVVAIVAVLWFKDYEIGGVIAAALVINLFAASLAGVAIPLILRRIGIDPALAGTVILTTITDVVGFVAFLGLATLLLR
jgi:magnesium transporter